MVIPQKAWFIKHKNHIFIGLLIFLTLKVIIPQLDGLYDSIVALKSADLGWILLGTIIFFSGVPILSLQFLALALKPLPFGLTYKVQMAGLFVSKLLPSALGSISLNMYYFVKKGHTVSQATTVITMNGLTSGVAYCFLIILSLAQSSLSLQGLAGEVNIPTNLIIFVLILLLGAGYLVLRSGNLRSKAKATLSDLKKNFATYRKRPQSVFYGLVCNFTGSSTSLFALYASAHAIGLDLSFAGALLAYTFGNVAATLVPTPGGIGSTEAGIYSGLVLVGIDGPNAMVVTLLYRLITYWVPILPGYYFFHDLRKTILSSFSIKKQSA
jgi:uncharacterized protein (TIRG00374 family)